MLASAVWIDAPLESHVRDVVVRDDALAVVDVILRRHLLQPLGEVRVAVDVLEVVHHA